MPPPLPPPEPAALPPLPPPSGEALLQDWGTPGYELGRRLFGGRLGGGIGKALLPGAHAAQEVRSDRFWREAAATGPTVPQAVAGWPLVGEYAGEHLMKPALDAAGYVAAGPLFPVHAGMQRAGEALEAGESLTEAAGRGVTAGLGAFMAGKLLGKGYQAAAHPGRKAAAQFAKEFPGMPMPKGVKPVGVVEALRPEKPLPAPRPRRAIEQEILAEAKVLAQGKGDVARYDALKKEWSESVGKVFSMESRTKLALRLGERIQATQELIARTPPKPATVESVLTELRAAGKAPTLRPVHPKIAEWWRGLTQMQKDVWLKDNLTGDAVKKVRVLSAHRQLRFLDRLAEVSGESFEWGGMQPQVVAKAPAVPGATPGIPLFGGLVPGPPPKELIAEIARDVGKLSATAARKFAAAVEAHGGDVLKVLAAMLLEKEIAKPVAQAIFDAVAARAPEAAAAAPEPVAPEVAPGVAPAPTAAPAPAEAPGVAPAPPVAPEAPVLPSLEELDDAALTRAWASGTLKTETVAEIAKQMRLARELGASIEWRYSDKPYGEVGTSTLVKWLKARGVDEAEIAQIQATLAEGKGRAVCIGLCESSKPDGKRSVISLYANATPKSVIHEIHHALEKQGFFADWRGTREEHAEYWASLTDADRAKLLKGRALPTNAPAAPAPAEAPAVPPAAPKAVAEKQPWEMTRGQVRKVLGSQAWMSKEGKAEFWKGHKEKVAAALAEGKPVPPEVLADYPDLAKPAAPAKPAPKKPATAEAKPPAPPEKPPPPPKAPAAAAPEPAPTVKPTVKPTEPTVEPEPTDAVRVAARRVRGQLKALHKLNAAHAATRKAFKTIIKRLPIPVKGRAFSGPWPETVMAYTHALEQAEKYLERFLKNKPVGRIQKARKYLKKHLSEMEPDVAKGARALLREIPERKKGPLIERDIDALDELADRAEEAVFLHRSREALVASQKHVNRKVAAEALLTEMGASMEPVPEGRQPATKELHGLRRLGRTAAVKTNTIIERWMGGEDSTAGYYFIQQIDAGHRTYCERVVAGEDNVAKAAEKVPGGHIDSEPFYEWWHETLTIKFPTLGRLSAERRYWLGKWLNLSDPDTEAEMITEKWAGFVWETAKEGKKFRPAEADMDAFRAYMAENEADAIDFGMALKDFKNAAEYFPPISEVHKLTKGTYLESVPDRWGRKRNVRIEKSQEPPDLASPHTIPIIAEADRYKLRTGSQASVVIRDPLVQYFEEIYGDAAYVGFAPVSYDAWKLLGTSIGGRTVAAQIDSTLGKPTSRIFFDHLRHVMATRVQQPTSEPDRMTGHLLRNATRSVLTWRVKPIATQLPSALAPIADTKPIGIRDVLSGIRRIWTGGEFQALKDDLMDRAAEFAYRWKYRSAMTIASPGYVPTHAASASNWWRRLIRFADKGMKGMRWADSRAITSIYAGHIRERLIAVGISEADLEGKKLLDVTKGREDGEQILQDAADATARHTDRTQPPNSPAHDTGLGRLSRTNVLWRVMTRFMSQRSNYTNMALRAHAHGTRTGDYRPFLWCLAVLAFLTAVYTAITQISARARGKKPRGAADTGLDYIENAVGNVYFGGELVHLLRAPSSYNADIRGNIAISTIEDTGKGLVDLRRAIFAGPKRGAAMKRAVKNLTRGIGGILGLPALALINTTEIIAVPFGGGKEGAAKIDALVWKASGSGTGAAEAAAELKASGMTLTQARMALRKILKAKGVAGEEQRKRLWKLSNLWYAATRRTGTKRSVA